MRCAATVTTVLKEVVKVQNKHTHPVDFNILPDEYISYLESTGQSGTEEPAVQDGNLDAASQINSLNWK